MLLGVDYARPPNSDDPLRWRASRTPNGNEGQANQVVPPQTARLLIPNLVGDVECFSYRVPRHAAGAVTRRRCAGHALEHLAQAEPAEIADIMGVVGIGACGRRHVHVDFIVNAPRSGACRDVLEPQAQTALRARG